MMGPRDFTFDERDYPGGSERTDREEVFHARWEGGLDDVEDVDDEQFNDDFPSFGWRS